MLAYHPRYSCETTFTGPNGQSPRFSAVTYSSATLVPVLLLYGRRDTSASPGHGE